MTRMTMTGLAIALLALLAPAAATAQNLNVPLVLSFDKADPDGDGVWHGNVAGAFSGVLTTSPTAIDDSHPVWKVAFEFMIEAGERSMILALEGILNTNTGAVVMNGVVTDGYLVGARVHEQGQLVDAAASRFQGSIRILPDADAEMTRIKRDHRAFVTGPHQPRPTLAER